MNNRKHLASVLHIFGQKTNVVPEEDIKVVAKLRKACTTDDSTNFF